MARSFVAHSVGRCTSSGGGRRRGPGSIASARTASPDRWLHELEFARRDDELEELGRPFVGGDIAVGAEAQRTLLVDVAKQGGPGRATDGQRTEHVQAPIEEGL